MSPTEQKGAEIYQQDGDYIKDIEVNDLRNRYTLTKGSTQKMVNLTRLISSPLILPERAPKTTLTLSPPKFSHFNHDRIMGLLQRKETFEREHISSLLVSLAASIGTSSRYELADLTV